MRPITEMKIFRYLAKPFIDLRRKLEHEEYMGSPDHFYLQTLKDIHINERCFIIGNGPSLHASDLDKLKGEYTFAVNRIFKIFDQTSWRPTYYLAVDSKVLSEIEIDLKKYDLGHMFLKYGECNIVGSSVEITKIYVVSSLKLDVRGANNTAKYISEDVSHHFCNGLTVVFEAIQLAIYMGFKEIYLLGIDNNYMRTVDESGRIHEDPTIQDYFDNKRYKNTYPVDLKAHEYAYAVAKEYCDTHGIKIYNATRGGKLEVFERVDFDTLFPSGK